MATTDIRSLPPAVLTEQLAAWGYPAFRARQIRQWLDQGVTDFGQMSNLPLALRQQLSEQYMVPGVTIRRKLVSAIDGTVKYLFALDDGETVESVLMQYKHGWSQCLSTQVGCKMGCTFCATGIGGFIRNLSAAEMLAQIEAAQQDAGIRVSSIVLMGMGEPLDNYDQVITFLRMLGEEGGVHIGMRHISLSTCGVVPGIYRLMEENIPLTLSISLHAPNDQIRSRTMPVNRRWPVAELLEACRRYADVTGRRISFEYAMIHGVNDSDACANELADRLRGMLCHVNLIPVNAVEGKAHQRSSRQRIQAFMDILQKKGINVTVRRTLGADINASCGQLRRQQDRENTERRHSHESDRTDTHRSGAGE
ncbi:MAG: 23S rRNA (adenine(2503)-C(2))-methyltransferase RlmN [Clostridia bacterium]|nr:23S rRNA (adenine(2503)-C(2))-methyltransferase RlmN [Clostridia bacterium]